MGRKKNAFKLGVGNPEGKRLLGRPKRSWDDNMKIDLRGVGVSHGRLPQRYGIEWLGHD
jgi:hypothetical protein